MSHAKNGRAMKLWAAGIGATALMVGPLSGVAHAAGNTFYVNNGSGGSVDAPCIAALMAGTITIQSAVSAASAGDTIVVCPGTYNENVTDTGLQLTFQSMTALGATVNGGGGSAFTLTGVGSSLDGFMLTGATNGQDTPAAFLQADDETVTNSTFDGDSNAATIFGSGVTLQDNTVQNPSLVNSNSAGFFFNTGGGTDSLVEGNSFTGDFNDAAVNIADPGPVADLLTIKNNTSDTSAGGNFVVAGGTTRLTITGNTIIGGPNSGTGILLLGNDSGYSVTGNTITGRSGASGVSISGGFGYAVNDGGDVSGNSLKGNLRGINVFSASGTITAHLNILVGNSRGRDQEHHECHRHRHQQLLRLQWRTRSQWMRRHRGHGE